MIFVDDSGEVAHPRTGQVMKPKPARRPRRWTTRSTAAGPSPPGSSARDNPALARNLVNRYWGYYFGRGLVNPIDDLRATNPASNPELLDALADDLIAHGYDIKHLLRTIMRSKVYQLSAVADARRTGSTPTIATSPTSRPSGSTAEQLLDAVDSATGTSEKFAELPAGLPGDRAAGYGLRLLLPRHLRPPRRAVPCECERERSSDHDPGPADDQRRPPQPQGLRSRRPRGAPGRRARRPPAKAIEELFLCTVSRPPTPQESREALADIEAAPSPKEGLEDLLWTLLNTREFQFNH